jgi:hypothetical protein
VESSKYIDLKNHVRETYEQAIDLQVRVDSASSGAISSEKLKPLIEQLHAKIQNAIELLKSDSLHDEVDRRGYDDRQQAFYVANAAFVTEMNKVDVDHHERVARLAIRAAELLAGVVGVTNSPVSTEARKRIPRV